MKLIFFEMNFFVGIFACLLVAASGQFTEITQCQGSYAVDTPLNTWVEGCVTPPCGLPQLQDAVIHIVYRAPRRMAVQRYTARAFIGILPIPYDLGERADACNTLTNSYCPLLEGEVVTSTFRMYIEPLFPEGIQLPLELSLADENNELVYCIRLTIRVDPPQTSLLYQSMKSVNTTLSTE